MLHHHRRCLERAAYIADCESERVFLETQDWNQWYNCWLDVFYSAFAQLSGVTRFA